MVISEKTTYLLAFSALSYRLQLSNCQSRFFLTFDTLTVTKKTADGMQRQEQHGYSESIHKNPLHFLFPCGIINAYRFFVQRMGEERKTKHEK